MKHVIIGTAGHIDHGKTTLTNALTCDGNVHRLIDRLKEERDRGITIELGFAELILPNGQQASIIDVPGHEKLIKHMLMGAAGMDMVLLVIDAAEGFMPQTKEHMEILGLLGVKRGIVCLTKADTVDEEWLEVVKEDIMDRLEDTFLEGAPIIPCSAMTGMGIDELKWKIVEIAESMEDHLSDKPFRMPVDRVFSIKGIGTVVTGSTMDGDMHTGENVIIYPEEKPAKVREMQHHEVKVDVINPGMRIAINLAGVDKKDLDKGSTIAVPGSMLMTNRIAVQLTLLKDAQFSVKNASRIHFYQGTQEMVAKIRLLDTNVLEPGQSGYALIMFDEKLTARNLDKYIIRFFSPMATIGGGVILDMESPKLKRDDPNVIDRLNALNGTAKERVGQIVEDAGCTLIKDNDMFITSGLTATEVRNSVAELLESGKIIKIANGYISRARLNRVWMQIEELLHKFHEDQSLAAGMHLGELRERVFAATPKTADAILEYFASLDKIRIGGGVVALAGFETAFSPEQTAMQEKLDKLYASFPLEHPENDEVAVQFEKEMKLYKQVLARMCQDGQLIAINSAVTVHKNTFAKALDVLYEMYEDAGEVTLGQFRDELGVSRKCAKMYLDCFDAMKITKMVGDTRVLLKKR